MLKITKSKLEEILGLNPSHSETLIEGISTDSRKITKNNLYVPIIGEKFNGHNYISDALNEGALFALCNKEYYETFKSQLENINEKVIIVENAQYAYYTIMTFWRKQFPNVVCAGIGGTVGKTTTKELLRRICEVSGDTIYTKENINTPLGMCMVVNELKENTRYLICEMGTDSFGEITTEAEIVNPDFGVCLNVGPTHAELLGGSIEGVVKAESELVLNFKDKGKILLNIDNIFVKNMQSIVDTGEVLTMSKSDKNADVYLESFEMTESGMIINLNTLHNIEVPIFGEGNIYNVMAAVTLAKLLGISEENVRLGLKKFLPEKGRLNIYKKEKVTIQDDAYNANLDSMKQSIDVAIKLSKDRHKVFVLGDMLELGVHAQDCHNKLSEIIKNNQPDVLIYLGDFKELIIKDLDKSKEIYTFDKINEENFETVLDLIQSKIKKDSYVLLKASKGVGVWKLVDKIF